MLIMSLPIGFVKKLSLVYLICAYMHDASYKTNHVPISWPKIVRWICGKLVSQCGMNTTKTLIMKPALKPNIYSINGQPFVGLSFRTCLFVKSRFCFMGLVP
jgi:hypothetical protein